MEVWKWSACHDDGSGYQGDWGTSRKMVQQEAAGAIYCNGYRGCKFKRVAAQKAD